MRAQPKSETRHVTLSLNLKTQELESQGVAGRWDWGEPQNPKAREPGGCERKGVLAAEVSAEPTLC